MPVADLSTRHNNSKNTKDKIDQGRPAMSSAKLSEFNCCSGPISATPWFSRKLWPPSTRSSTLRKLTPIATCSSPQSDTSTEPEAEDHTYGQLAKGTGLWTPEEHERFLEAIALYPKGPWKSIADMVGTRTVRQTQTHAQKHREKQQRRQRGLRNRKRPVVALDASLAHSLPCSASSSPTAGTSDLCIPLDGSSFSTPSLGLSEGMFTMEMQIAATHLTPMAAEADAFGADISMTDSLYAPAMVAPMPYPWLDPVAKMPLAVPDFDESLAFLMDCFATEPTPPDTMELATF